MGRLGGWIFEENAKAFVALLASVVGYTLYDENYDWIAIEYGLGETDADHDKWYTYPLIGKHALTLEVAQNRGAAVVDVRVTSDQPIAAEVAAQWELLITLCQDYDLTHKR